MFSAFLIILSGS